MEAAWLNSTYWHKASCLVLDTLVNQGQQWVLCGRCNAMGVLFLKLEAGLDEAGTVLQPRLQVGQERSTWRKVPRTMYPCPSRPGTKLPSCSSQLSPDAQGRSVSTQVASSS